MQTIWELTQNCITSTLSCDWAALDRDTAHRYPVIWCSHISVSPACHNWVTWLTTASQQLTLLPAVRNKALSQAPPPWRYNVMPWWRHIRNITSFWNLDLDTLSDVKTTGKYWVNFVVLTWRDQNNASYGPPHLHRGASGRTQSMFFLSVNRFRICQTWPRSYLGHLL